MRFLRAAVFALFLAGCATTSLQPVGGQSFTAEEDEKRLWAQAAKEAEVLSSSGFVLKDPGLEEYLTGVLRKLATPQILETIPFRIEVVSDPQLNAFARPNGSIVIHSGLLAQMENEAQLATIIAHEMTHATHRHSVRQLRNLKNQAAFFGALGNLTGQLTAPIGLLGMLGGVSGYSREMETEADEVGFRLLVAAGYDPAEAPKVFRLLDEKVDKEDRKEPFFFSSHPKLVDRRENYERLVREAARSEGMVNAAQYLKVVAPLIVADAGQNLKRGRFAIARGELERYTVLRPGDGNGYFLLGETYRQEGKKEDLEKARQKYLDALKVDPSCAEAYRALGVMSLKQKELKEAREHLERYLKLAPSAPDRGYVEQMIETAR